MKREALCKCDKVELSSNVGYNLRSFIIGIDVNGGMTEIINESRYLTGVARSYFCNYDNTFKNVAFYKFHILDAKGNQVHPFHQTIYIKLVD